MQNAQKIQNSAKFKPAGAGAPVRTAYLCTCDCVQLSTTVQHWTVPDIKSHAFGVRLTRSTSISRSQALCNAGGLKSHALWAVVLCSHRSANSPYTVEIFTSSTEESNPKLLSANAFPEITMSQKRVGGRTLLPRTLLKELTLTALPKISHSWIWGGRFATEKRKGKEMWKKWREREGGKGKGEEK